MGKKRRYRNNPQKFGRKYSAKYGIKREKGIVEEPLAEKTVELTIEDPVVAVAPKAAPPPPPIESAKAAPTSKKSTTPKKKTPAAPRKVTRKKAPRAKTKD